VAVELLPKGLFYQTGIKVEDLKEGIKADLL
jgi:hypothetical protein